MCEIEILLYIHMRILEKQDIIIDMKETSKVSVMGILPYIH
jgi:hypothetical protein